MTAPRAAIRPHAVESPNGTRTDPYYWLRDDKRENPEILAYLKAENTYKDAKMAHLKETQDTLFDEIVGRIKQDDSTVPYRYRGHYYYRRFEQGGEYPIYARRQGSLQATEQVMLDVNVMAKDHDFYQVAGGAVSPNGKLFAFAEDSVGRREYVIRVKDLATGRMLPDRIVRATPSFAWANDNRTLFYIEKDPVTLLGERVRRHTLGATGEDPVVYEETDNSFYMSLGRSGDEKFVVLSLSATITSEVRYLSADQPGDSFSVLLPRQRGHEYSADHIAGRWVLHSNLHAQNFRILELDDAHVGNKNKLRERVPHQSDVLIHSFELFDRYLVISERAEGLRRLRVMSWDGKRSFVVKSDEPAYTTYIDVNREQDTHLLRYTYSSLTTPKTVYELNLDTEERKLLKRDEVLGGFRQENYQTERLWAKARDGRRVPVTLVYKKGFVANGTAPLYQYGYGSYGSTADPWFRSTILSLVDRGFVFAIAHIRGGQEMGRAWYDDGKLMNKKNTFTDFVAVTEHLLAHKYADPNKVAAAGGSAGGLLIGAVANMRPDLYTTLVAHVPFVDIVTTMLDESIPLTTNEFDEWGNPKEADAYRYMLSYSPYDNVKAQDYPAMLVTTGLWDSQVQYYEPAKWVAKLRATKTDTRPLLFHVNMEAGHGGKSGRFRRHRESAMEYAFVMDQLGLLDPAT